LTTDFVDPVMPVTKPAEEDAESYVVEGEVIGGPVDAPIDPFEIFDVVKEAASRRRPPVIPPWLRSAEQRRVFAHQVADMVGYHIGFHTVRSPKYAVKTAWYAPIGVLSLARRQIGWWWVLEQHAIRQHAASRNEYDEYLRLHREAKRTRLWRGWVLGGELATLAAGGYAITHGPWWAQLAAAAVGLPSLARAGRPADKPITDRTSDGPRFTRLSAEMVRAALVAIGAAKLPEDLKFPKPGVHRDGPGWLARVNLPPGSVAVDVLEKRANLSSALRLPIDQVWPSTGPDHEGQLDLWVGYLPASRMGRPKWSLASPSARTSVFEAYEFAFDQRLRPVKTILFERNFLVGGVPGSGKSYGARTLAYIAALDPICELKIAEFKGTADFGDFAPLCSSYVCGIDDASLEAGADIIAWGLAEAERRGRRIRAARERGEAPEGKVTPELAARPGSGLHPVVIVIDEAHELLVNKEVAADLERLIKRGRALGIIIVLATQIPDRSAVPPAITRCVTVRWCMAVQDQVANDMILGTGAYKRGLTATAYRPGEDAGCGIVIGISHSGPIRSHYPDVPTAKAMIARAATLRGHRSVGADAEDQVETRDVVADVLAMFAPGERGMHWQIIAARLADQLPDAYEDVTPDAISAWVRARGVESTNVNFGGSVLKGCRKDALQAALRPTKGSG
jgi:S-DNA-T family DNA segregation ATPase FtsK/SpoIIIE